MDCRKLKRSKIGRIDCGYSIFWDKKTEITHLTIPSLIDDIPVIKVESGAFNDCHSLKYVIISDNVSTIGYDAFWNCVNLEGVFVSNCLKVIKDEAFGNCEKLKFFNNNKNIKLGESVFENTQFETQ